MDSGLLSSANQNVSSLSILVLHDAKMGRRGTIFPAKKLFGKDLLFEIEVIKPTSPKLIHSSFVLIYVTKLTNNHQQQSSIRHRTFNCTNESHSSAPTCGEAGQGNTSPKSLSARCRIGKSEPSDGDCIQVLTNSKSLRPLAASFLDMIKALFLAS